MNTTDTTLIQLMNDGFSSIRSDMNSELKTIKNDISSINTELAEIKVKMSSVNKQIYGNGKKGLADRVTDIENALSSGGLVWKAIVGFIAWVIATGIAVYAAIK